MKREKEMNNDNIKHACKRRTRYIRDKIAEQGCALVTIKWLVEVPTCCFITGMNIKLNYGTR